MGEWRGSDTDGQLLQLPARFWKKVDQNGPIPEHRPDLGPCWLWKGLVDEAGYANRTSVYGNRDAPHRFVYRAFVGPIPDGLELDHLCRVRRCVRYSHLEPVTHAENQERMAQARTHCVWGHLLSGDNLTISGDRRVCRACNTRRQRELHAKRLAVGAKPPPDARCKYGHPYDVDAQGRWFCRECGRKRAREWKARQKRQEQG